MKKLVFVILILGILSFIFFGRRIYPEIPANDTIIDIIGSKDTMVYVLCKGDTIDWWHNGDGYTIRKADIEFAKRIEDSLLELGYEPGFMNK